MPDNILLVAFLFLGAPCLAIVCWVMALLKYRQKKGRAGFLITLAVLWSLIAGLSWSFPGVVSSLLRTSGEGPF